MNPPLWFANFFSYCIQVALVVSAGTALPLVFRLRAPRVLLAYWQGVLAACLLLPLIQPWKSMIAARTDGSVSIILEGASPVPQPVDFISVYTIILGVLLIGMLVRLAWLALGLKRLHAIRQAASAFEALPDCVRKLESTFRVSPAWCVSPRVASPATFGIRPPSILLPERFPSLAKDSQRAIAGHELLHVVRRDWVFNLVEELILTVFWFHPAMAWVVNRIRLSREQVVDAEVVRLISARKCYMSALLEIASNSPSPALGAAPTFLRERQLAHRIELLVKEATMSKARLSLSLAGILALLLLAGGVAVWAFPLRAPAQAASSSGGQAEKEVPPLVITAIEPVETAPIVYPPEAQETGIEGRVKLRVTINKDGNVEGINILSGHPELVKASAESVIKWRYAPSNVDRVTIVTIVFARPRSSPFVHPLLVWPEVRPSDTGPLYFRPLKPISAVRPVYPSLAKTANVQGKVALRVTVGTDGSVSDIQVTSGHPLLVKAALDAVQKWRYAPMGEPAVTVVTLDFTPPKGDSADNAVTPPMLIYQPNPPYPQEAKAAKLEGNVVLQVMIQADGTVSSVEVVKSLDKRLDDSAVQTVKTWKFLPAMKAGKPVPCKSTVSVHFKYS